MWKRATWHECAAELDQVCLRFRTAYWGERHMSWPRHPADQAEMEECSVEGVKLLRAIALAIRSEQDFDLAPNPRRAVGVLKSANATRADATNVKQRSGFQSMLNDSEFIALSLRQALNKIAHADPLSADYYVGPGRGPVHSQHDLLLFGDHRGQRWFAAISILELVKAVQELPDINLTA